VESAKETLYTDGAMPIYEYRCEQGHTFELLQRMSEEPLATCEQCEAPAVRVLHAPAVHFKGSGFYNTDYGTRKRAREKGAEGSSNGEGSASKGESSAKSESSKGSEPAGGPKKAESAAA
jgi:putative FmdB family regulatory protein